MFHLRNVLRLTAVMALLAGMAAGALAQAASEADRAQFQTIIANQIKAFQADDGPGAFAFASPGIKQRFGTHEIFMQMVKQSYGPVYRPQKFTFGEVTEEAGRPTQHVTIIDAEGRTWTAYYGFEKQPDGTWLISGCVLRRIEGEDA